jgi:hypothetical protein
MAYWANSNSAVMSSVTAMMACTAGMNPSLRGSCISPTHAMATNAHTMPALKQSATLRCRGVVGVNAADRGESPRELCIVMCPGSIDEEPLQLRSRALPGG